MNLNYHTFEYQKIKTFFHHFIFCKDASLWRCNSMKIINHMVSTIQVSNFQKGFLDYALCFTNQEVALSFFFLGHFCFFKGRIKSCSKYTVNILTVLSTTFGIVMFPIVVWLCMSLPKTAIDLKLHSSMSLSATGTAIGCDNPRKS